MLPEQYQWIAAQFEPEGSPWLLLDVAQKLEESGNLAGAATVYDRAFGIAPEIETIRQRRASVLDQLSVVEHGLCFRYVPAGPFLMGSNVGEPDEQPWHPVWLSAYWLSETPISWAAYCRLMDWSPPPEGFPANERPRPTASTGPRSNCARPTRSVFSIARTGLSMRTTGTPTPSASSGRAVGRYRPRKSCSARRNATTPPHPGLTTPSR